MRSPELLEGGTRPLGSRKRTGNSPSQSPLSRLARSIDTFSSKLGTEVRERSADRRGRSPEGPGTRLAQRAFSPASRASRAVASPGAGSRLSTADFHLRSPESASGRATRSHRSGDISAAHAAYDRAFDVLASSAEALDRKHDAALGRALRKAQERCVELTRERDEARAQLAQAETEHCRLSLAAEHKEAEHHGWGQERAEILEENARLKRELRTAQEEVGKLQRTSVGARQEGEEHRARLERTVDAQRRELEAAEEQLGRAKSRGEDLGTRSRRQNETMFALMVDTVHMLFYLTDLLSALQALFYDPTPFVKLGSGKMLTRSASAERVGASYSRPLLSLSGGGYAGGGGQYTQHRFEVREGTSEQKELISALEKEVADAALRYTAIIQATSDSAQQAMRIVGMCGSSPTENEVSHLCDMWMDQDREHSQGLEWGEQRARFKEITRTMESKFAQLVKLKRVLGQTKAAKGTKKPKGTWA